MRKKASKKMYPNKHRIIEILRERGGVENFVDGNGNLIALNLRKHFLYGMPYSNKEFQAQLVRKTGVFINESNPKMEIQNA
jgi:hypothetical protein